MINVKQQNYFLLLKYVHLYQQNALIDHLYQGIVQYYAQRPQVQERLTLQIVEEMQNVLKTKDVACVIDAKHICINSRGVCDPNSSTITSEFGGVFKNEARKNEFLDYIKIETEF